MSWLLYIIKYKMFITPLIIILMWSEYSTNCDKIECNEQQRRLTIEFWRWLPWFVFLNIFQESKIHTTNIQLFNFILVVQVTNLCDCLSCCCWLRFCASSHVFVYRFEILNLSILRFWEKLIPVIVTRH